VIEGEGRGGAFDRKNREIKDLEDIKSRGGIRGLPLPKRRSHTRTATTTPVNRKKTAAMRKVVFETGWP